MARAASKRPSRPYRRNDEAPDAAGRGSGSGGKAVACGGGSGGVSGRSEGRRASFGSDWPERGSGALVFINLQKRLLSSIEAFARTKVIGITQPGRKVLRPGEEPGWSEEEGTGEQKFKKRSTKGETMPK